VSLTDSDHLGLMLSTLRKWLQSDVKPVVLELDHADIYPSDAVEQMKEFGLFGATIPTAFGGLGLSALSYAEIVSVISETWMSLTGVLNSHLMMAHLINRFGTQEQRSAYLPELAAGVLRGGLALTEPDCGTDLQAIRTVATRQDDGTYSINGTKTWITNAKQGNCLAVLVKTDPTAHPRHKEMSMFPVKKLDGYDADRKLGKMGYRGVDTAEVIFDRVVVPGDRLLGGIEGQGFVQTQGGLELGRLNVAARGLGIAKAALDASVAYSSIRHTMGKPIGEHQAIAIKLADMACRVASARALVREAAEALDAGRRCDLEAGMAKLVATEAALENATEAMRIHGAYGYSTEDHIERYYRDAPLLCIGEGTNEIQRIVIARNLLARAAEMNSAREALREPERSKGVV
jgi:alkylation response protein AidB-like acyl-CoA dehydrogenase